MGALAARVVVLVIEGGASRAAYASGVAQALQEAGVVPDAIYGTSAGGAIGAWYAARQAHVGVTTWDKVTDRALLSYRRALVGRPVIDFRRLYSHYYPNVFGMDLDAIRRSPFPVHVTVTDADTGETLHPDLRTAEDPLVLLHATSALPLVSETPVLWQGRRVLDGGATDPLPVRKALDDGWRDLVVVSNRPLGPRRPEPALVVRLVSLQFPRLAEHVAAHHLYHNDALALAERPPEGARVRLVRPGSDLGVSRLTRDAALLRRVAQRGREDGARVAKELLGEAAGTQATAGAMAHDTPA